MSCFFHTYDCTFFQNIRGMRIPVSLVVNLIANEMTTDEIIKEYPDLEPEDIKEALQYASWLTREELHPAVR